MSDYTTTDISRTSVRLEAARLATDLHIHGGKPVSAGALLTLANQIALFVIEGKTS